MKHKTFEVEIKAAGDSGEIQALAAVFGNVDLVGDRIKPGAFTKTLKAWQEKGDPIPIVSSHSWDDPMSHIGIADAKNVTQTKDGLLVKGQLDMDNPLAAQVHRLMKRRSLTGWSFGYTVPEGGERMDDKGVNNITEIDLVEVGPTLKGANPEAQLQAVKSALAVDGEAKLDSTAIIQPADAETLRKRSFDAALEISREHPVSRKAASPESVEETPPLVDEESVRRIIQEEFAKIRETGEVAIATAAETPEVEPPEPAQVSEVEDGKDEEPIAANSEKDEEPQKANSAPQDPLRTRTYETALGISNGGMRVRKHLEPEPEPEPPLDAAELRRRCDRLRLEIASGE